MITLLQAYTAYSVTFSKALLRWYSSHHRDLPWRRTRDPYAIWVSEIMLQQTRVEAAIPFYTRFLERFPDPAELARACEADVLAAWSGLGYYSRARNLQRAARKIVAAGGFPRDYEALLALPGIGPYTAAAIASIAYGLPHAAVDGNVLRVLARVDSDSSDIGSEAVKSRFRKRAGALLDRSDPGTFNQALMELGATTCTPRQPRCPQCPVAGYCHARREGIEGGLPVKRGAVKPAAIKMTLVIVKRGESLLLWKREAPGMLAGFWELPDLRLLSRPRELRRLGRFHHSIMNRRYTMEVATGRIARTPAGCQWVSGREALLSTAARKALAFLDRSQVIAPHPLDARP